MEGGQPTAKERGRTERTRWNQRVSATCQQTAERRRCGVSERMAAKEVGVPLSTLRHWSQRKAPSDLPASCVEFFESPDGVDLLQRILVAAHLVFGKVGPCGTRQVVKFLQLSRLDRFVDQGRCQGPWSRLTEGIMSDDNTAPSNEDNDDIVASLLAYLANKGCSSEQIFSVHLAIEEALGRATRNDKGSSPN